MHEYSIMADIVKAALASLEGYQVENVEAVLLDVGELTFLNPEQLKFCFKVLTEDNVLSNATLEITQINAEIKCLSCGYQGPLSKRPEESHFRIPRISCPECEGKIELLSGRECIVRSIRMNIRNEDEGEKIEDTG